jgi:hypothetical protein
MMRRVRAFGKLRTTGPSATQESMTLLRRQKLALRSVMRSANSAAFDEDAPLSRPNNKLNNGSEFSPSSLGTLS